MKKKTEPHVEPFANPEGNDVVFMNDAFPKPYDVKVPKGERDSAVAKALEMQQKGFTAQAVGKMKKGRLSWLVRVSGWGQK